MCTQANFIGATGDLAFLSGKRSKVALEFLRYPGFIAVANWTEGLISSTDGLHLVNKDALFWENDKNKTIIIAATKESNCWQMTKDGEFSGYCADLAKLICDRIGVQYEIKVSSGYGVFSEQTNQWNGVVALLLQGVCNA